MILYERVTIRCLNNEKLILIFHHQQYQTHENSLKMSQQQNLSCDSVVPTLPIMQFNH